MLAAIRLQWGLQLCSFFAAVNNLGTQDLLDGRKSRAKGVIRQGLRPWNPIDPLTFVSGGERGSQREGTTGADSRIVDGGVGYQSLFFDATDSYGG